jgi:hypothetical protein
METVVEPEFGRKAGVGQKVVGPTLAKASRGGREMSSAVPLRLQSHVGKSDGLLTTSAGNPDVQSISAPDPFDPARHDCLLPQRRTLQAPSVGLVAQPTAALVVTHRAKGLGGIFRAPVCKGVSPPVAFLDTRALPTA